VASPLHQFKELPGYISFTSFDLKSQSEKNQVKRYNYAAFAVTRLKKRAFRFSDENFMRRPDLSGRDN